MAEIRRRVRKPGEKQVSINPVVQEEEPKEVIISKEETESEDELQNRLARERIRQNQGTFTTARGMNEIKSELTDDRRSQLVELNYWNETHSWGSDSEAVSDDYSHFLGRYE